MSYSTINSKSILAERDLKHMSVPWILETSLADDQDRYNK